MALRLILSIRFAHLPTFINVVSTIHALIVIIVIINVVCCCQWRVNTILIRCALLFEELFARQSAMIWVFFFFFIRALRKFQIKPALTRENRKKNHSKQVETRKQHIFLNLAIFPGISAHFWWRIFLVSLCVPFSTHFSAYAYFAH